MINQEQNQEKKKLLKTLKNEHLADAEICQDAVHWAFQKSYKQLGRPYDDWNELEIQDIISWQSKPFIYSKFMVIVLPTLATVFTHISALKLDFKRFLPKFIQKMDCKARKAFK